METKALQLDRYDQVGEDFITNELIRPSHSLLGFIHHYDWFEVSTVEENLSLPFFPNFAVGILFTFYQNQRISVLNLLTRIGQIPEISLFPPATIPVFNQGFKNVKAFRCIFLPGALSTIYRVPLNHFHNELLDASKFLDPELSHVYEQMWENPTKENCTAIFESYLKRKVHLSGYLNIFQCAQKAIYKQGFHVKAHELADELGISKRQLNRKMNQQIGFASKKFLQVNRFQAALNHIHKSSQVSLAQTAYHFGYTDQAHFSHEFKLMTGLPPKKYLQYLGKKEFYKLDEANYYSGTTGYRIL